MFIYLFKFWLCRVFVAAHGLCVVAHRLSCSSACGVLVPQPGIEFTCSASEGKFLTTGPPGKSLFTVLFLEFWSPWSSQTLSSFSSTQEVSWVLPMFLLHMLHPGNFFMKASWGNYRAQLAHFPYLRDHCPSSPDVQGLKNSSFIFFLPWLQVGR